MLHRRGAHVLTDGQFGSTGKGLFAAYLAEHHRGHIECVVSNAGPNSGHTFYVGDEKVVLKQLPSFSVYSKMKHGITIPTFLSPGAVIDPELLNKEVEKYGIPVSVSTQAAIIRPADKEAELGGSVFAVAGTRQGVGQAISNKVLRQETAVAGSYQDWHPLVKLRNSTPTWDRLSVFVEVSQGFSLGIHSQFYPFVTSRECTVMQAIADARIPAQSVMGSFMVVRTFPIRVGNADGFSSGGHYDDQRELTWEEVGVKPELTTVTQRVRRVFTFSAEQFAEALRANRPTTVLMNFMNYLPKEKRSKFADTIRAVMVHHLDYVPKVVYGHGPLVTDISDDPEGK